MNTEKIERTGRIAVVCAEYVYLKLLARIERSSSRFGANRACRPERTFLVAPDKFQTSQSDRKTLNAIPVIPSVVILGLWRSCVVKNERYRNRRLGTGFSHTDKTDRAAHVLYGLTGRTEHQVC